MSYLVKYRYYNKKTISDLVKIYIYIYKNSVSKMKYFAHASLKRSEVLLLKNLTSTTS